MAGALRVLMHSDYILSRSAKTLTGYSVILALILSLYTFYPDIYIIAIILHSMAIGFIYSAGGVMALARELSQGEAQVYLAAGLRRAEYVAAWILALVVFPALSILAATTLPIIIIRPDALHAQVRGAGMIPVSHLDMALFFTANGLVTGALGVLVSVLSKKPNLSSFTLILYTFILPFVVLLVYAVMVSSESPPPALLLAPFNPLLAFLLGTGTQSLTSDTMVSTAFLVSMAYTVLALAAARRLET